MSYSLVKNFSDRAERKNFPGGDEKLKDELLSKPRNWFVGLWLILTLYLVVVAVYVLGIVLYSIPGFREYLPAQFSESLSDMTRDSDLAAPFDSLVFAVLIGLGFVLLYQVRSVISQAFGAWRLSILEQWELDDAKRDKEKMSDEVKSLTWAQEGLREELWRTRSNFAAKNSVFSGLLHDIEAEVVSKGELFRLAELYRSDLDSLGNAYIHELRKREDLEEELKVLQGEAKALARAKSELSRLRGDLKEAQTSSGMKALKEIDDIEFAVAYRERLKSLADDEKSEESSVRLMNSLLHHFVMHYPERLEEIRKLSYVSEEQKRIDQYDTILRLYNKKIAELRDQKMDEEDREEAILAMKRLRDREIDALEQA